MACSPPKKGCWVKESRAETESKVKMYFINYFIQNSYNRRDAQVFYLGLSYRFGKSGKKQQEEKLEFDNNL
jgi:hypothetical protein